MNEPGTLYWHHGKYIKMLIETKEVPLYQKNEQDKYIHVFVNRFGKKHKIYSETEKIEDDPFWNKHYKRIEL